MTTYSLDFFNILNKCLINNFNQSITSSFQIPTYSSFIITLQSHSMLHNFCISWTSCLKSEEVLPRVKEERNILQITKQRKAKWLGYKLCRNCLLKCVIDRQIEGMRR